MSIDPSHEPHTIASDVIAIAAPIDTVWAVLADFPRYGEWNPLCREITVDPVAGGAVAMRVWNEGVGDYVVVDYTIAAFAPPRHLAWTGRFAPMGLVARRDQFLQAVGPGQSLYWTVDIYTGPSAAELAAANGQWISASFNDMAEQLRLRAEAQA